MNPEHDIDEDYNALNERLEEFEESLNKVNKMLM